MQGQGDGEYDSVVVNNDGGDIYGDGERHDNYTKSNSDGNTDGDTNDNDIDMDFDSDINTNSDGDDLEGDDNMEHDGVEVNKCRQRLRKVATCENPS
ncbi:hypothetical protein CASFOL_012191 [Castilleja foliolosa]|uniref:Uncharacterized protein n=1 Tax=Castilleja foliolosa TaxID=1961234 RepID=A0ABD3DTR3_9LAMI